MTLERDHTPAFVQAASHDDAFPGRDGIRRPIDAQLFQILIAAVEDYAIYMLDPDGIVATWNKGAWRSKGYTADEIIGKHYRCFFTASDIATGLPERQLRQARQDGHYAAEGWRLRKDGTPFWASISLTAIHSSDGQFQGFAKVTRDLTDVKAREEALRISEASLQQEKEVLRVTLESIAESVVCVDSDGLVTLMNRAAERTMGRNFRDVQAKPIEELMPVMDADGTSEETPLRGALNGDGGHTRSEDYLLRTTSGESRVIECWTAAVRKPDGERLGAVAVFHDVTEERASLQNLEFQATHDSLTGLLNRRGFRASVGALLQESAQTRVTHTLCFIDLDSFKAINDSQGHDAGDAVLKCIAAVMQRGLGSHDLLARLGGDEFAILLQGCEQRAAVMAMAAIQEAIRTLECGWQGKILRSAASIGLYSFVSGECAQKEMMRRADIACYDAKAAGRDCIRCFGAAQAA